MHVDLFTSGIWQTTSTILSRGRACVVFDPAYFPRELDAIAARVREIGHAEAVIFTHGHWDHVMGHAALPEAPVWLSQALATAITSRDPMAARYLEDAREFDSRWYVPRPQGHRWPTTLRGLSDGERLELGGSPMHVLHLPGHSPEGLGVIVEELGLMLVGDYLSPCEIPFVDDAPAYLATLDRMLALLAGDVAEVMPGHGPRLGRAEAQAIARADRDYLTRLIDAGTRRDAEGARALELPRAADVVGMRAYHLENCAKVGLVAGHAAAYVPG